ncbi:AraC family transcriptional regulator [Cohnella thailandensis]|uniref:Helix-turn-helix transcriptional regulator n=1 Tax=Cohnella thailandensis TaxID=557557 RepID=A0A841SZ09_9BACL|nr:AraC family transcriptional regulator [Cohnella thailandensis]MBB6635465.1 helix-turn-helix transcriptional regulator [Cohnella thailandensis]MBP1974845.1 AraC-like DNA-binding protein [Cohnella thailandensis]
MLGSAEARLESHVYWHRKERFALDRDLHAFWTMFAVETGRFRYKVGRFEGEAGSGELVLCPPGTWFYRETVTPLSFHYLAFRIGQADGADSAALEEGTDAEATREEWMGKFAPADRERLASTFRYLRSLEAATEPRSMRLKQHLLNDLLRMLELEQVRSGQPPETGDEKMLEAKRLLADSGMEPLSLSQAAKRLGLTPVQLTRKFRSAFGLTPSAFLTETRLDRACRLLRDTSLGLDEIARQCGYENGFYLSRVFLKVRGIRPSAYRKRNRV